MNKLDVSQAVDPNKRQPLPVRSVAFIQNAIKSALAILGVSLVGDSYSASIGYIIWKGRQSGSVIADGFVIFNDEPYYMTGDDISGYSDVAVVVADNTNGPEDPITFTDGTTGNVHNVRKLKVVDQVSGTGLFDYSAAVFLQDNIVRAKILSIGTWDMDATFSVNVPHGLTASKIRGVSVIIIEDSGVNRFPLNLVNSTTGACEGGYEVTGTTNVALYRVPSGFFDGSTFNSGSPFNRGWVTINYID